MACPKCGCRMVTKVGHRSEGRFVCSQCGRPIDGQRLAREQTRRWQAALTAALLALAGTLVFLLATASEVLQGGDAGVEEAAPGAEVGGGAPEGRGGAEGDGADAEATGAETGGAEEGGGEEGGGAGE